MAFQKCVLQTFVVVCLLPWLGQAFWAAPSINTFTQPTRCYLPRALSTSTAVWNTETENSGMDEIANDDDDDDMVPPQKSAKPTDGMERAWRYAKKPLLRIGAKGATASHGNSLRQLLDDHTVVKVKVNTQSFDGSLETAFATLRSLAEQSGAPSGIELLQARQGDKILLVACPGTRERIANGEFPEQTQE